MKTRRWRRSPRSMPPEWRASPCACSTHMLTPNTSGGLGGSHAKTSPQPMPSLSHEILREFREYERTSTTVLNSYVGPIVRGYLGSLENTLTTSGFRGTFRVMQSNGGVMSAETAKKMPVSMMESGPVAGVIAAARLGESLDCRHIISFDMGGTTGKSSLIKGFHPEVTSSYYVGGYVSGHPMMLPVVDIVEVGNGGGSIAWVDAARGF